jgi:hypothetical protein
MFTNLHFNQFLASPVLRNVQVVLLCTCVSCQHNVHRSLCSRSKHQGNNVEKKKQILLGRGKLTLDLHAIFCRKCNHAFRTLHCTCCEAAAKINQICRGGMYITLKRLILSLLPEFVPDIWSCEAKLIRNHCSFIIY